MKILSLFLVVFPAFAATQAEIKAQLLEDFGACSYKELAPGDPVATVKTFAQAPACDGKLLRLCEATVKCEGGAMIPPEMAKTASFQMSCPITGEHCPTDPLDCMAEPARAIAGASAIAGGPPRAAAPRGEALDVRRAQ